MAGKLKYLQGRSMQDDKDEGGAGRDAERGVNLVRGRT